MEKFDGKAVLDHKQRCEDTRAKLRPYPDCHGPWMHEPDRLEFKHEGLDCLMVRHPSSLHWCGYVGVPKGHPLFGKHYNEVHEKHRVDVHGGLTYSEGCGGAVCHNSPEDAWWFGFDCAHSGDVSPGMRLTYETIPEMAKFKNCHSEDRYRDMDYVRHEVESLAEQIAKGLPSHE